MKKIISRKTLLKEAGVFLIASLIILSTAAVTAITAKLQATMSIPGDCDGDGDVDHSDLGILLSVWGKCEGDEGYIPEADFDGSGCIDHPDLGILLANWGAGT